MKAFSDKRNRNIVSRFPIIINAIFIGFGVFILIAMSAVLGVFEEFTAFTDYTQDWIEFNFFLHYWDKLAITRTYLALLFIYGAAVIAISAAQIHAMRKRDLALLRLLPFILLGFAIVTVLGAIAWLIVTAVNFNEGFLATGGFIFERMRFKGNVWKDLKYREESFRLVAANKVPQKAEVLSRWVHQRERDFDCCAWDSYKDYALGGFKILPESCCKRKYRQFDCGLDFMNPNKTDLYNTRGCGPTMYSWYRRGFVVNIVMACVGIIIAVFEFVLYTINNKQYSKAIDEIERRNLSKADQILNTWQSSKSVNAPQDELQNRSRSNLEMKNLLNNKDKDNIDNNYYETSRAREFDDHPKPIQTNNRFERSKLYRQNKTESSDDEDDETFS